MTDLKQEDVMRWLEGIVKNVNINLCSITPNMAECALALLREKDKEIERLKAENEEQDQAIIRALHGMGEIRRTARAEAVDEFSERVKKAPDILDVNGYSMIGVDIVELIAEEMKGNKE